VAYLSALEICSRRGAIQIHVYLTLPYGQTSYVLLTGRLSAVWEIGVWVSKTAVNISPTRTKNKPRITLQHVSLTRGYACMIIIMVRTSDVVSLHMIGQTKPAINNGQ